MNRNVILFILLFNLFLSSIEIIEAGNLLCDALAISEAELSEQTGQLIYFEHEQGLSGLLSSTYPSFPSIEIRYFNMARVSPDGQTIASLESDGSNVYARVVVRSIAGEIIFSTSPEQRGLSDIAWLSNQEILTIVGIPPGDFYAYSIINPFTDEIRYVHPLSVEFDNQNTTPLFDEAFGRGSYSVSPGGRYIITVGVHNSSEAIYDYKNNDFFTLEDNRGYVWSYVSDHLLFLEVEEMDDINRVTIYSYDISEDSIETIATFDTEATTLTSLIPHSWSPDERWIVLVEWIPDAPYSHYMRLLEVETGTLYDTCFTGAEEWNTGIEVAWSRDSRYLALNSILGESSEDAIQSLNLYDLLDEQTYEMYRANISLVGWAAVSE